MHYLITGGCGFIGSHLAERLVAQNHLVTVVDDLSNGKRENLPAQATFIRGDITMPGIFDPLLAAIDGCFHLAAIASVQLGAGERGHQVNRGGTMALFKSIARCQKYIPVVYASSAAVYGNAKELPVKETAPCTPLSDYGTDKLRGEEYARQAAETHRIPSIGLRFFNVYGKRQDPDSPYSGVISIFGKRMKAHDPITIYGDGGQSRDFIHVSDVVRAMTMSMQALEQKKILQGIFNICTGRPCSINELVRTIAKITGSRSQVTHVAKRNDDIRQSLGDATLAKNTLRFEAALSLEKGLAETLEDL